MSLINLELLALVRTLDGVDLTFPLERLENLLHFESGFIGPLFRLVFGFQVLDVLLLFGLGFLLVFVDLLLTRGMIWALSISCILFIFIINNELTVVKMIHILLYWVFNLGVCHSMLRLWGRILIFGSFNFVFFRFRVFGVLLLLNLIQILHTKDFVEHRVCRFNVTNLLLIVLSLEAILCEVHRIVAGWLLHSEVRSRMRTNLSHELLLKHVQLWQLVIHLLLLVQNLTFEILQVVAVLILVVLLASLIVQILLNLVDYRHELFVLIVLRKPILLPGWRIRLLRFWVVEQLVQLVVDHGVELVVRKDSNSILLNLLLDILLAIIVHRFLLVLLHDSHTGRQCLFLLLNLGAVCEISKAWHLSLGDKGSFSDALNRFLPTKLLNDIVQGLLILLLFGKAEEVVCCSGIRCGLVFLRNGGATLDMHLNFLLAATFVHWCPIQGWSQLNALWHTSRHFSRLGFVEAKLALFLGLFNFLSL